MPDAVVSQVLIAETLISQYFTAVRGLERAMGRQDEATVSERIGDAARIYPEIWEHLDRARDLLAQDNRDVTGYDVIRREQGKTVHFGVKDIRDGDWQVDVAGSLLSMGLSLRKELAVETNVVGAAYALQAAEALKAALPEVDWAAAHGAAEGTAAEYGRSLSLTRGWRALLAAAVGIVLGVGGALLASASARQHQTDCVDVAHRISETAQSISSCGGEQWRSCAAEVAAEGAQRIGESASRGTEIGAGFQALGKALEELESANQPSERIGPASAAVRESVSRAQTACSP